MTLIEIEGGVGDPSRIAAVAATRAVALGLAKGSRKEKDSFEEGDEVWAVFDRDEHERFDEALARCSTKGISVARSNPCFEVWLILHFDEFDKPDGRHRVQQWLKELCPEYDPAKGKTPDCQKLMHNIVDAELRAERQLFNRGREGNNFGPPSSNVFELTRRIRLAPQRKTRGSTPSAVKDFNGDGSAAEA